MGNPSRYSLFEDTLSDLEDCYEHMNDDDLSLGERKARKSLIKLCRDLADDYEDELETSQT